MTKKRAVHLLMTEIGPLADLMAVAEYAEDNLWRLMVDEETIIDAYYDESQESLVLSSEVAIPNAQERAKLYALLLEYNGYWERTGGVYMSLEDESGPVVQTYRCSLHHLDRYKLKTILENFTELLHTWRNVVRKYENREEPSSSSILEKSSRESSGFMRG